MTPTPELFLWATLAVLAVVLIAGCLSVLGAYANNQRARQRLIAEAKRQREAYQREMEEKAGNPRQPVSDEGDAPDTAGTLSPPSRLKKAA